MDKPNHVKISVVSPVYKAESLLEELCSRITNVVNGLTTDFEIVLVDDCSPDNSWELISKIAQSNPHVRGIRLSRNFGQHYAIAAGLENSTGEWVVVMDCDLQDVPEEIANLYSKAMEGNDVVLAQRVQRKDTFYKKATSYFFYRLLSYLTEKKQDETVANFGIYHRKVICAICSMKENIRYFPTMVNWVGFKQTKIEVKHSSRGEGVSSYNLRRLLNLALDIVLSNSEKPIRLVIKMGLFTSFLSFCYIVYIVSIHLMGKVFVLGYSSLIISICFFSGLIISFLGIVGLYVGKTFEGVKNRPYYIIDKTCN